MSTTRGSTPRRWRVVALGAAALVALIALGPRPETSIDLEPVDVPSDASGLESWLSESEAAYSDIVPGAEKTIVWGDPGERERTPLAVVYLHGFSATRQETAPLADSVAARLGANLFYTRLTGHGRSSAAMGEASVSAWAQDAAEAIAVGQRLGERVVIVATSTGATLAIWAAAQPELTEPLAAVAMISPNLGPRDERTRMLTWPWGGLIARLVQGPTYAFEPANALHERYWTEEYPTDALAPMMGLVRLAARVDGDRVHVPMLMAYAPDDQVVDPARAVDRFASLASPIREAFVVEGSGDPNDHVLAGDILSPQTTDLLVDRIVAFVRGLP